MDLTLAALLLVGGLLGASSLIISKKPEARDLINKLVPFQAGIGVAMLVLGLLRLIANLSVMSAVLKVSILLFLASFGTFISAILLGFFFGMPLIAKWIPGDSPAEEKAEAMAKKIGPFSAILGIIGIVCALLFFLYEFKILKVG